MSFLVAIGDYNMSEPSGNFDGGTTILTIKEIDIDRDTGTFWCLVGVMGLHSMASITLDAFGKTCFLSH